MEPPSFYGEQSIAKGLAINIFTLLHIFIYYLSFVLLSFLLVYITTITLSDKVQCIKLSQINNIYRKKEGEVKLNPFKFHGISCDDIKL